MTVSSDFICKTDPNIRPQPPASRFSIDELLTLAALVNIHIRQLIQLSDLEERAEAKQKLGHDLLDAERLRDKLAEEYQAAVRIPGVTS